MDVERWMRQETACGQTAATDSNSRSRGAEHDSYTVEYAIHTAVEPNSGDESALGLSG